MAIVSMKRVDTLDNNREYFDKRCGFVMADTPWEARSKLQTWGAKQSNETFILTDFNIERVHKASSEDIGFYVNFVFG